MGEHLHFELRWHNNPGLGVGFPGVGHDPLQHPEMFVVRAPVRKAIIKEVGLTPISPTTTNYRRPGEVVDGSEQETFVVLQIVHEEGPRPRRLSPQAVTFLGQNAPTPHLLTMTDEDEIKDLKPASNPPDYGFAIYEHGHETSSLKVAWDKVYKYWFRWDVSGYASSSSGPRTFSITTTNYASMTADYTLKWGPQVLSVEPEGAPVNNEQLYRLRVRAWRGEAADTNPENAADGNWSTGADWLHYELPTGGKWAPDYTSAILEETAAVSGMKKFRTNDFLWPVNSSIANPVLTVRSRTTPSIAHEWPFLVPQMPARISITIHSFAGTSWDGVATPVTISGVVNPGAEGRAAFAGSNGKQERGAPLFSGMVEQGAMFYVCDEVRDFLSPPGGAFVNRTGASSFIAVSADGERRWANLSAGAWRISGGIVSDWEYQLRYSSGDGTTEHPGRVEIGTVPNSNFFSGQEITDYEVVFEP